MNMNMDSIKIFNINDTKENFAFMVNKTKLFVWFNNPLRFNQLGLHENKDVNISHLTSFFKDLTNKFSKEIVYNELSESDKESLMKSVLESDIIFDGNETIN